MLASTQPTRGCNAPRKKISSPSEEAPTLATRIQDAKVLAAILTPQARAERDLYDRVSSGLRKRMAENGLFIIMFFLSEAK